jgi:hypothetical protein
MVTGGTKKPPPEILYFYIKTTQMAREFLHIGGENGVERKSGSIRP